jgi:hypothetical protein
MNPYQNLPQDAFWRTAIAERNPLQIEHLWKPKFPISNSSNIATAGSCFAQHIGKAFISRGYNWLDGEPSPPGLSAQEMKAFNYGIFSFRTGNLYTAAALKQWVSWALNNEPVECEIWETKGRYFDPFRPNIEPNGFSSTDEAQASSKQTLKAIRNVITRANVFVFTLGLTEAWINERSGDVYPMCPGTVAGEFDASQHKFKNYSYPEILADLRAAIEMMTAENPQLKFLLTVSPVPLTATASGQHVLTATTYSKSVLRAAAGDVANAENVDYFPSYEIITGFPFRGMFFEPNMRNVVAAGVEFVMKSFFTSLEGAYPKDTQKAEETEAFDVPPQGVNESDTDDQLVCEEELLAAFGDSTKKIANL